MDSTSQTGNPPAAGALSRPVNKMDRRLRLSAALCLLALVVEEISLRWSHPTAFLLFAFVAGGLLALGILIYFYSLLTQ